MSATTEERWIPEDELAKALGVDRDQVKRQRPYAPTGGVRVHGKAIEWNAEAIRALEAALKLPHVIPPKNAAPTSSAARGEPVQPGSASPDGIEELAVASSPSANGRHFANPNLIRCKRANAELVLVRVMDSAKYQPTLWNSAEPMMVKAKKSPAGNWWELIGREPRWRGRF